MAWQNPKTDWETGDVPGAGDFNRTEGNTQFLKEYIEGNTQYLNNYIEANTQYLNNRIEANTQYLKDYIEKDGLFILPSETVILQANTERSRHVTEEAKIVKKFWVKFAGIYRVYFEIFSDYDMTPCVVSSAFFSINVPNENSWRTYNFDVFLPPGLLEIVLSGRYDEEWGSGPTTRIRNVRLKGTLMTRSDVPSNAVLQD